MNEPHMATYWFPANDHPRDKAPFDIRITVPKGKKVIANGVLVGKKKRGQQATTHWRRSSRWRRTWPSSRPAPSRSAPATPPVAPDRRGLEADRRAQPQRRHGS